jgi:hypothetical protein
MKTQRGRDLWKWIKEYKERRAKELGITFGRPGADNPDDNDNIGRALMALPPQDRPLYLRAVEKGDVFMQDFLTSRDRGPSPTISSRNARGVPSGVARRRKRGPRSDAADASRTAGRRARDLQRPPAARRRSARYGRPRGRIRPGRRRPPGCGGRTRDARSAHGPVEILSHFRLLIIPTGALSDWSMSEPFRRTMEAYVSGGGTILAFAQQLGKEYAILPSGKESPVAGYGFAEDQSCQYASSQITRARRRLQLHDETDARLQRRRILPELPPKSAVWLSRTKNDQPCMISYPHGKGASCCPPCTWTGRRETIRARRTNGSSSGISSRFFSLATRRRSSRRAITSRSD